MRAVPGLPGEIANSQDGSTSDFGHRHPVQHAILSENRASPPACRLLLRQPEELLQVREIVVRAMSGPRKGAARNFVNLAGFPPATGPPDVVKAYAQGTFNNNCKPYSGSCMPQRELQGAKYCKRGATYRKTCRDSVTCGRDFSIPREPEHQPKPQK